MKLISWLTRCAVFLIPAAASAIKWPEDNNVWAETWTSMAQEVESRYLPPNPFGREGAHAQFENATLRQTVRVSVGAERIRVQFSNLFGQSDLPITAGSVALPERGDSGVGGIDVSTIKHLTFDGAGSIVIPPKQVAYSDPVDFSIPSLANIAVTIYSREGQAGVNITGHPGSRTTSWMETGNKVDASSVVQGNTTHWYFLSAVEAWAQKDTLGLVILGDSITDGYNNPNNGNNRWPDFLAQRLQANNLTKIAVNNQAADGNAVLERGLGPPLLTRYHRDAIGQKGVKYVMIFEGVNDIGPSPPNKETQARLYDRLVKAYTQIIRDCRAAGLVTIGATITPFGGSGYEHPLREATRVRINQWILESSPFDHTLDFAAFIGDGDRLRPEFAADPLHPNVAGYRELVRRFDLDIFQEEGKE
ncbi:SGNH/GDSL hydrolase family protein [Aspergillus undulatus]|uniref:SGNH/GDSL hydrolase family protein n=1 Tax=Aspergillus undulatus TaxID=1810928 RepID=UPI003CCDE3D5